MVNTLQAKLSARRKKGFTLVELIIVIAILAVLIGFLTPQYLKYVERSRQSKDAQTADELFRAVTNSIADEEVYDSIVIGAGGKITYTFDKDGITVATTGADTKVGYLSSEVADLLDITIDDSGKSTEPKPSSKMHQSGNDEYVVTVRYDVAKNRLKVVSSGWQPKLTGELSSF